MPLVCGALALTGCSGTGFLNALTPRDGYSLDAGVRYGDGPRRLLDVYTPAAANGTTPTLIFFYGGSWQTGERQEYRFVGQAFAAKGYRVVIPDYRLYPEVRYPTFLEDAAAAVAWAARTADEGAPIFLVGHSAGAYNAAMLALDPRWLASVGLSRRAIEGVATLAGPFDFLPLEDPDLMAIFGPMDERPKTQPIAYVDGAAPPMLLLTGDADDTVYPRNSIRLAAAIEAAGGQVAFKQYPGLGHLRIVGALAKPTRFLGPVRDDIVNYFRSISSPEASR
jgi:acetyl esterase/lipase